MILYAPIPCPGPTLEEKMVVQMAMQQRQVAQEVYNSGVLVSGWRIVVCLSSKDLCRLRQAAEVFAEALKAIA